MILFVDNNAGVLFIFRTVISEVWRETIVLISKITKEIVLISKIRK
jgi:hypothetical protein